MKLLKLRYENYRNLKPGEFFPGDKVNVVYGGNAHGKTNLLEAIWLFTGRRSFRGAKDRETVEFEAQTALLKAEFFAEGREIEAEIRIRDKRVGKLGGIPSPPARFSETVRAVVFSPEHLSLVKDAPELRRRFVDDAVSGMRPNHAHHLASYRRAMAQRSALLREAAKGRAAPDMAEFFEDRMAAEGEKIVKLRKSFVAALNRYAKDIYSGLSGGKECFYLAYEAKSGETRAEIFENLRRRRDTDMKTGQTLSGPHRDDLDIRIDDRPVRQYGSQGQQRSAVLTLKLAEAAVVEADCGEKPLLLLDDVMSELDPTRQHYLLNHGTKNQIFITCCDPAETLRLVGGEVFRMENGVLKPESHASKG